MKPQTKEELHVEGLAEVLASGRRRLRFMGTLIILEVIMGIVLFLMILR